MNIEHLELTIPQRHLMEIFAKTDVKGDYGDQCVRTLLMYVRELLSRQRHHSSLRSVISPAWAGVCRTTILNPMRRMSATPTTGIMARNCVRPGSGLTWQRSRDLLQRRI